MHDLGFRILRQYLECTFLYAVLVLRDQVLDCVEHSLLSSLYVHGPRGVGDVFWISLA